MKVDCEATPTKRSVPAKQASKMLYLLCSLGLYCHYHHSIHQDCHRKAYRKCHRKADSFNHLVHGTYKNKEFRFGFSYVHGEFLGIQLAVACGTFSTRRNLTKCFKKYI